MRLYLLLGLLLLPLVAGTIYDGSGEGLEQLFSSSLASGNSIELDGRIFVMTSTLSKASMISGDISLIVDDGDCVTDSVYAFCVDDISLNSDNRKTVTGRFYKLSPAYDLNITYGDAFLYEGIEEDASLSLENEGQVEVTGVRFELPYPNVVEVSSVTGSCDQEGNSVIYEGDLNPGESVSCDYDITPTTLLSLTLVPSVTSTIDDTVFDQELDPLSLSVDDALLATLAVNDTSPALGESFFLNFSIKNSYPTSVDLSTITFEIPDNLNVTDAPSEAFEEDGQWYVSSFELEQRQNISFLFYVESYESGASQIEVTLDYVVSGKEKQRVLHSDTITTDELDKPVLTVDYASDVESYELDLISVWVENPNIFFPLHDLQLYVYTNLTYSSGAQMSVLGEENNRKILSIPYTAPVVEGAQSYDLYFALTYSHINGSTDYVIASESVTVSPESPIDITQSIGDTSIYSGNWTLVSIGASNGRNDDIKRVQFQTSALGMSFIGKSSARYNMDSGESIDIYDTFVLAPEVNETTVFTITTIASFSDDDRFYTYNTSTELTVEPREVSNSSSIQAQDLLSVTRTLPENIFAGDYTPVSYSLENEDNVAYTDIRITFPPLQGWEVLGSRVIEVDTLAPKSTLTLPEALFVIPSFSGSQFVEVDTISYLRPDGTPMTNHTDNVTVTVQGGLGSRHLFLERSVQGDRSPLQISYVVRNLGSSSMRFTLADGDFVSSGVVSGDDTFLIQRDASFNEGIITLPSAHVAYDVGDSSRETYSNVTRFTVLAPLVQEDVLGNGTLQVVPDEEAAQREDVASETTSTSRATSASPTLPPSNKGFFSRIFSSIFESVLGWLR